MPEVSLPTIKRLFAVSQNKCAFTSCDELLIDMDSGTVTGRICHICASSPNGPRFDPAQTDDERNAFDNLLLLCNRHHDIIDKCPEKYPVATLREIKRQHAQAKR